MTNSNVTKLRTQCAITTPSIPLLIGNALDASDKAFHGVIDDIRIYNKAKSADFVAGLYTLED